MIKLTKRKLYLIQAQNFKFKSYILITGQDDQIGQRLKNKFGVNPSINHKEKTLTN